MIEYSKSHCLLLCSLNNKQFLLFRVMPSFARPNYLSYLLQVYSVQSVTIYFTDHLQQEHRWTQDELVKTFYDLFACVI